MTPDPHVSPARQNPPDDGMTRAVWSVIALLGVAVFFFVGGGLRNLAPPEGLDETKLGVPQPIAPEGELNVAPVRFTWTPGTEGALAQVVIHHANLERMWASAPLTGTGELIIPESVWDGIGAGQPHFWRVRETVAGRPAGGSRWAEFLFNVDTRGYRAGEAPTSYDMVH